MPTLSDTIDQALIELEKNQDIQITTARSLVIQYLTQAVSTLLKTATDFKAGETAFVALPLRPAEVNTLLKEMSEVDRLHAIEGICKCGLVVAKGSRCWGC